MRYTTGVAGVIYPFRELVNTSHTGSYLLDPHFLKLCSLIKKYNVIFRALILVKVIIIVTISKFNGASVLESEYLLRLVVLGNAVQLIAQLVDVVINQLRIGTANNERFNALVVQT